LNFFNLSNASNNVMIMGFTEPLTGISTRNLPGSDKVRPAGKADNLTGICELTVLKMRDPENVSPLLYGPP
jgi:hypothetical protein